MFTRSSTCEIEIKSEEILEPQPAIKVDQTLIEDNEFLDEIPRSNKRIRKLKFTNLCEDEQKEITKAEKRERMRKSRLKTFKTETPEQKEERLQKERQRQRERFKNLSAEQLERRRQYRRMQRHAKNNDENAREEIEAAKAARNEKMRLMRANETPEERRVRQEKERRIKLRRLSKLTPEQRERRRVLEVMRRKAKRAGKEFKIEEEEEKTEEEKVSNIRQKIEKIGDCEFIEEFMEESDEEFNDNEENYFSDASSSNLATCSQNLSSNSATLTETLTYLSKSSPSSSESSKTVDKSSKVEPKSFSGPINIFESSKLITETSKVSLNSSELDQIPQEKLRLNPQFLEKMHKRKSSNRSLSILETTKGTNPRNKLHAALNEVKWKNKFASLVSSSGIDTHKDSRYLRLKEWHEKRQLESETITTRTKFVKIKQLEKESVINVSKQLESETINTKQEEIETEIDIEEYILEQAEDGTSKLVKIKREPDFYSEQLGSETNGILQVFEQKDDVEQRENETHPQKNYIAYEEEVIDTNEGDLFKCKHCFRQFKFRSSLFIHELEHRPPSKKSPLTAQQKIDELLKMRGKSPRKEEFKHKTAFECHICHWELTSQKYLDFHIKNMHKHLTKGKKQM